MRRLSTLACSLVASLATVSVVAAERQTLVVGIIIDGLDLDKIEQLRDYFGQGGFRRLLDQGVVITDLDYAGALDATSAATVIYTGASPSVNGVAAGAVFDAHSRRMVDTFDDTEVLGNYTSDSYSPKAIRVSTLTDELVIDAGALGYAHSIAPSHSLAIASGGHAANSAVWIDDASGKWASSTYYNTIPAPVKNINHYRPLSTRIDTVTWRPTMPDGIYDYLPSYKRIYAFRHSFPAKDARRYQAYKASPRGNSDITALASEYIRVLSLGKRDATDMLNIAYTLQPYTYSTEANTSAELLDTYFCLDRNLATLFDVIDRDGPGMDKTIVFVAGTPVAPSSRRDDERWRIPTGDFSPQRAVSLLNVDLIATFGNGDWVAGYHDGQIFLNRDLIAQRGLNIDDLRTEAAEFMRKMSGVTYAATLTDVVVDRDAANSPLPPSRNVDINTAGDIFFAIAPGWRIVDENPDNEIVVRTVGSTSAAFILAPSVDARTIDTPVDARQIAPTIARLLRIRSPNGAALRGLHLR